MTFTLTRKTAHGKKLTSHNLQIEYMKIMFFTYVKINDKHKKISHYEMDTYYVLDYFKIDSCRSLFFSTIAVVLNQAHVNYHTTFIV